VGRGLKDLPAEVRLQPKGGGFSLPPYLCLRRCRSVHTTAAGDLADALSVPICNQLRAGSCAGIRGTRHLTSRLPDRRGADIGLVRPHLAGLASSPEALHARGHYTAGLGHGLARSLCNRTMKGFIQFQCSPPPSC
jgi:hypothetical protein